MMAANSNEIVVGFPLYDGATLLDFAGATQVFAFADDFKPIWLAHCLAPVSTSEGVTVNPGYTFSHHPEIGLLFVPGGIGSGVAQAMQDERMLEFIKKAAQTAEWSGSVCVGAFINAAAGILHDCRATTYWSLLETLNLFPGICVDTTHYPRAVFDSAKKRFSGGGVSSSIDLALELVMTIKDKSTAEMADLSIQYAPDPPVKSGDPSQADAELVNNVLSIQKKILIDPITDATRQIISSLQ